VTIPSAILSKAASPIDGADVVINKDVNVGQSESSICVNPNDKSILLNSNNSFGTGSASGTLFGVDNLMSSTFGNTWTGTSQGVGNTTNYGDPAVAIDRNGKYYVGYITGPSFGQSVSYSTNAGISWTNVNIASGGTLDKNHLWVDNSVSSPYLGSVYSAWSNLSSGNNQIEITGSVDGGVNWSPKLSISNAVAAGSHNQGVNLQTGPNGEVYAVWAIYDSWPSVETALGFSSSTNGGTSFIPASRIISNIKGIRGNLKTVRVNSFPSMTVDVSNTTLRGTIYVVWANQGIPGTNTGNDVDVYLIKSTNGGGSWSTPIRINQDPINAGKKHWLPWIACDNVTGALSVVFYDDRNVTATNAEVFVANSFDGGNTWSDFRVGDYSFTPSSIPGLAQGYFGDYIGIDAQGGKVYPCWFDNRSGKVLTYVSPFDLCVDNLNIPYPTQVHTYYEAKLKITASSTINQPTSDVIMDAGQEIALLPGFNAVINSGSTFQAYIDGCGGVSGNASKSVIQSAYNKAIDPSAINRNISLYPNPTNGNFVVSISNESEESENGIKEEEEYETAAQEKYTVCVYDIMGQMIFNSVMNDNSKLRINISDYSNGIYFLKITDGNRSFNTKIIKR
jgi:hypothetical protein